VIEFDFHVHTFFSNCGIHTHLEMLARARALGMRGLAITDHGPMLKGRINSPFFERFHGPVDDVKLLKGMECNLSELPGEIDVPAQILHFLDIVLLGIHPNTDPGLEAKADRKSVV
jgi:putative hydrolase